MPASIHSNRVEELASRIRAANAAYYNTGDAILEDAAYDALRDELRVLAPGHELLAEVGAPAGAILSKAKHAIPMGSQDKAMNRAEFESWVKTLPPGALIVVGHKMDGGSGSLDYAGGKLVRAVTRGDGFIGEDITANALQFKETPKVGVMIGGKLFTGSVRAEIMLRNEEWKEADPDLLKNPRNCGNGISRRKDGDQAELLTVYAFRAYYADGSPIADTEEEMGQLLAKAGFNVPPSAKGTSEDIWAFVEKTLVERATLPYWIDGLVAMLNDIPAQIAMGESDNCPKGQRAIKFPAEGKLTVLRSVELSVGHTGAIIPTAKFDPVELGGTTVSSALLCNWDVIRGLDVAIGDSIVVYKAGEIIPKVLEVSNRPANRVEIAEPAVCPVCGGPVGRKKSVHGEDSAMLYCLNDDCPSKVSGKIDRYIRSLNILGIGDEVLAALISELGLKSPAGLYVLHQSKDALESLEVGDKGIRLGAKRAGKILEEIEKTRDLTLSELLGSLGIDGLGKRRVTLIQNAVPGKLDDLAQWLAGNLSPLSTEAGVPNLGPRLSDAVVDKKTLIEEFLANGVRIKASERKVVAAGAKSFCFTGPASVPRTELKKMAEDKGHIVKDDVAKGLDYLVMADPESTSSKAVKARKNGTTCISEEEFRQLIG